MAERFSRSGPGIEPISTGGGIPTRGVPTGGGIERVSARIPFEDHVFVDVGARKIDANVSRDGVPIGALPIDRDRFDDFFGGRPAVTQKIVSQSVAPGTPVPVGTKVDLVLAEPGRLPIDLVSGVHADLREQTVAQVYQAFVEDNLDVRRILARVDKPESLTPEDEETIRTAFAEQDVEVGDQAGRDVGAAFQTLKAAFVFGQ